jgi:hypothetical protein
VPADEQLKGWLESLEAAPPAEDELVAVVAYAAGQAVALDPDELHAARRRAVLVLAAGGDPHRELSTELPAAQRLADELDDPARRGELLEGLAALAFLAAGLPLVARTLTGLLADPDLAWRAFAVALLAEELAEDD